jgi:putative flippase GtrA
MKKMWPTRPRVCDAQPAPVPVRRLARFSIVGALGIVVQLGALASLTRVGVDYLVSTVLAVEAALLHNFFWHQRYTWRDRASVNIGVFLARLLRFHLTNGAVSLSGNALAMRFLVGELHLPIFSANLISITACWLLNYLLSDRVVFTRCES